MQWDDYDYLLRKEKISKAPSRGTIYKNPTVNYASTEEKRPIEDHEKT
jgi:hypothetical protein